MGTVIAAEDVMPLLLEACPSLDGGAFIRHLAARHWSARRGVTGVTSAGLDPEDDFRPWLRPQSAKWWARINRFWRVHGTCARVRCHSRTFATVDLAR